MQLHEQHIHGRTAELKHASSRTMEACKQQNHGSMQAAEPCMHASSRTMHASSRTMHATSEMSLKTLLLASFIAAYGVV